MDRLDCLRAFVATVEHGGMAAAARKLNSTRARISKQIQALEHDLAVQLLMRTTRSLSLTEAGTTYFESAVEALHALDDGAQRAREGVGVVKGLLRINAPVSFGIKRLAPLLPRFQTANPDIQFEVTLTDELVDPVRGGYDVTIRIAILADSSLVARRIGPVSGSLVASRSYLAKFGTPKHPSELTEHRCLHYGYQQTGAVWVLQNEAELHRVAFRSTFSANNGEVLQAAAEADLGIALLPHFIVGEALQTGKLVRVLEDWTLPSQLAVNAVYPANRRLPIKTRRFIDFLVDELDDGCDVERVAKKKSAR
jgi:DNA-binding transcriptional LysR family regulator